jgi:hypothetical protein
MVKIKGLHGYRSSAKTTQTDIKSMDLPRRLISRSKYKPLLNYTKRSYIFDQKDKTNSRNRLIDRANGVELETTR